MLLAKSKVDRNSVECHPKIGTICIARRVRDMSLKPQPISPVPEETVRVARAAFPKGNLYLTLRDEIGTLYSDSDFAALYPTHGQPTVRPWRLALICVLQFIEDLSDRQAFPLLSAVELIGNMFWGWN